MIYLVDSCPQKPWDLQTTQDKMDAAHSFYLRGFVVVVVVVLVVEVVLGTGTLDRRTAQVLQHAWRLAGSLHSFGCISCWHHAKRSPQVHPSAGKKKIEIWPQRPMCFAATIAMHYGGWHFLQEWHISLRGWHFSWGVSYPWGFDFGPYLVDGWWGGIFGG